MTTLPVWTGIKVTILHHLGSIAFGSFIVAVIQFVRLMLEYIDRKTKKMQQGNVAAKWVMCCLRYCLWYG
jgi:choline transporter-like protein 2/4/5